jgi:hypothetical protein
VSLIDVQVFISLEINTYPRRIRRSSNLGHIFRGKRASYRPGNTAILFPASLKDMKYNVYKIIGRLWLVYVILLIMSILLGNEHGIIPVSRKP